MRFELPETKKLTLEMVIPIRWGDMDAMGHVNNTIYFRYLEIVRIECLRR
jgi:acyl-CoA thioester hydrolase